MENKAMMCCANFSTKSKSLKRYPKRVVGRVYALTTHQNEQTRSLENWKVTNRVTIYDSMGDESLSLFKEADNKEIRCYRKN